jgi:hypothetical protein
VTASRRWRRSRHIEARLWTGPAGHLVGGALDLAQALARFGLARALRRRSRARSSPFTRLDPPPGHRRGEPPERAGPGGG